MQSDYRESDQLFPELASRFRLQNFRVEGKEPGNVSVDFAHIQLVIIASIMKIADYTLVTYNKETYLLIVLCNLGMECFRLF